MKSIISCLLVAILVLNGLSFSDVKAQENLPLIIEPIYPENQNPKTKGYFDLSVNPGEVQSLKVRITNNGDEELTVRMKTANAYTYPTGGMMYEVEINSPNTILLDDAVRLTEYLSIEEAVKVPPQSFVDVPIELRVPQLDGQNLLGGILFTTQGKEAEQQQEVEDGTANFVLKTETVYAIAVQLNLPTTVTSNLSLGEAGFIPATAQVFIEMMNDAHKIQEEITGTYRVTNEDGNELFSGDFGPFKMAPKSMIRYPFHWEHETLEDGTYTLDIQGNIEDQEFSNAKKFTIKNKDVQEFVERTQPNVPQANVDNGIPTWVWVIGGVLFGIVMFLLGKRKK
jgi:hypothetical protein